MEVFLGNDSSWSSVARCCIKICGPLRNVLFMELFAIIIEFVMDHVDIIIIKPEVYIMIVSTVIY
jgi:hypothetical protein